MTPSPVLRPRTVYLRQWAIYASIEVEGKKNYGHPLLRVWFLLAR